MGASAGVDGGNNVIGNFNSAAVLNTIVKNATGNSDLTAVNALNFVSVANTAAKIPVDPLLSALTTTLSKTIFSIRPYSRKFKGLFHDNVKFGNHTRKINIADSDWQKDERYDLTDGTSIDMYKVKKPKVLQMNYYGQNIVERQVTIFRDQLNVALSSEEEFQRFITMVMTNASDLIEQAHESCARMTLANFMASKISGYKDATVINLLAEYNALTGGTLKAADVYKPDNFVPFVKWAFARIKNISDLMTERTQMFHENVTGSEISRHTPYAKQKMYMNAQFMNEVSTMVLGDVFHDDRYKLIDYERVGYWQNPKEPTAISISTTARIQSNGSLNVGEESDVTGVIGCLFDEEAMGVSTFNEWSAPTPFNAKGGYTNIFWHFNDRYYNDFTENGVVFVIQDTPAA